MGGEKREDKILSFDTLYTNNHIQQLKILCSYLDHPTSLKLAAYIKWLEFQYTLSLSSRLVFPEFDTRTFSQSFDLSTLCDEIMPFCDRSQQEKLQNIRKIFTNLENLQEMMQMINVMKEFMPEDFSDNNGLNNIDLAEIMNIINGGLHEQTSSTDLDG